MKLSGLWLRKKLGLLSIFFSVTKQKESRQKKKRKARPPYPRQKQTQKADIDILNSIKKKICMSDDTITNEKDRRQNEKTHFQIIYPIKHLSLEYIKSNYNSITNGKSIKKQADDFNS